MTCQACHESEAVVPVVTASIEPIEIQEEMERSFLDYAMSVITARALPDVRDGLKPVHRRILWGMLDIGARPDRSYMKCARVTGDVSTLIERLRHGFIAYLDPEEGPPVQRNGIPLAGSLYAINQALYFCAPPPEPDADQATR